VFAQVAGQAPLDNSSPVERRLDYIESVVYSNNKADTLINVLGVLGTLILGMGAYLVYQGNKAKELAQQDLKNIRFLRKMVEDDSEIVTELTRVILENSTKVITFLRNSQDEVAQNAQGAQELRNQIKQYLEETVAITDNIKSLQQTISAKSRIINSKEYYTQNAASSEIGAKITGTQATISDILKRLGIERDKMSHYTEGK
jgi:hypothetical protein